MAGKDVCWVVFIVVWMHFCPSNLEKEATGKSCRSEATILSVKTGASCFYAKQSSDGIRLSNDVCQSDKIYGTNNLKLWVGVLVAGGIRDSVGLTSKIIHIVEITWMLPKKDLTAGIFSGNMRMPYRS